MHWDLASVYYSMAIFFMSLMIFIALFILFLLFYMFKKVSDIHRLVTEKLDQVGKIVDNPADMLSDLGVAFASKAIKKVQELIK